MRQIILAIIRPFFAALDKRKGTFQPELNLWGWLIDRFKPKTNTFLPK